ncbi:3-hydroxy-acyl-(acyl-carrier-protein) dehydratase [Candidatus Magnetomoraceae bacterium gMMP-15]
METIYDIQSIMKFLPHRYPFILVDRIIELIQGEKVVGLKNVTFNEPFFQGHFPGHPIMPGVLIVEAMAQTGGILAFSSLPEETYGSPIFFMGMDKVKFRRPVVPGDQLFFEINMIKQKTRTIKMSGKATVENELAAEAVFMAALGEKSK